MVPPNFRYGKQDCFIRIPHMSLNAVTYSRAFMPRGSSHDEIRHLFLAGRACSLGPFLSGGGDANATEVMLKAVNSTILAFCNKSCQGKNFPSFGGKTQSSIV